MRPGPTSTCYMSLVIEFNLSIEPQNTDRGSYICLAPGQDSSSNPSYMRESPDTGRAKARSVLEGLAAGGGQSVLRDIMLLLVLLR